MTLARGGAHRACWAALFATALPGNTACMTSYALMQTAHTVPAKHVELRAGLARVFNAQDGQAGRDMVTNTTPEPALRVGLSDFLDVGVAPWLGSGVGFDAKLNLLEPSARFALAPRLAAGYAFGSEQQAIGIEAGLIGSYRLAERFEPYVGLSFADHWFSPRNVDPETQLAPNQRFAARRGYGDGLVKVALGAETRIVPGWRALLEYDHWFPAQDDPGDGYSLLSNDVVALSIVCDVSGG